MLGPTLEDYELFIYALMDDYPIVHTSTLTVIRQASNVATVEGELIFPEDLRMHIMEVVRFDLESPRIARYGYEVWQDKEKLYWYDSQPHPNDPTLASTDPHHKHIPPNIKRNRIPAPDLSFESPNIPFLIGEIKGLLTSDD